MKHLIFATITLLALALGSCVNDEINVTVQHYTEEESAALRQHLNLPELPFVYDKPGFTGANNDRATLGRVLFYDKRLSANNSISCANCHKQDKAFSDDVAFSKGFDGQLTSRNSLPLASVLDFQTSYDGTNTFGGTKARFFWDERAESIVEQSRQTLQNPIEMGTDLTALGEELMQEDYYKVLFDKAFVNEQHLSPEEKVLTAIQDFVNSIFSDNSKFDKGLNGSGENLFSNFTNFSDKENLGKTLFLDNCAACHGHDMKSVRMVVANNGLDEVYTDKGLGGITLTSTDEGVFKVPMLRNIALTAPYMHDGRFSTLEEVVEHYNSGLKNHANLNPSLKDANNEPKRLFLTDFEKSALIDFLNTLTDQSTTSHERFSDPFKP